MRPAASRIIAPRYTGFYKRLQAKPAGVDVFDDANIANILREWGTQATPNSSRSSHAGATSGWRRSRRIKKHQADNDCHPAKLSRRSAIARAGTHRQTSHG
jgi:hypothetical protein